jgi:Zierdtviridae DNA helicase
MSVTCELSEDQKRIEVWFSYSPSDVAAVKRVPGAHFVPKDKSYNGAAHWTIPKEMESARSLRRSFGDRLELGEAVKEWARRAVAQESQLSTLAVAERADLTRLPIVLPDLYRALHVGPRGKQMTPAEMDEAMKEPPSFQTADVAFGVVQQNPLNGNEPGLGKTLETIGAIFEAGTDDGPQLVIAPKTALESTWQTELEHWQPHPVYVSTGSDGEKRKTMARFVAECVAPGKPGWIVVNPDQVRLTRDGEPKFSLLPSIAWANIVLDEAHKNGVRNPKTLAARGLRKLKTREGGKTFALTGTPMGGRIINLWGLLNFLNPSLFSSKWRWAESWTDITDNGYGKTIGPSIKHCERHFGITDADGGRPDCVECKRILDDFYRMLTPYIIRRTKKEALPYLPEKDVIPLWCDFADAEHKKQYTAFAKEAEVIVNGASISATNILAEYTRLKQFSSFKYTTKDGKLVPTASSGKLDMLEEKLTELGIWDGESDEQAVIFSQFSTHVDLIHKWLLDNGIPAAKITGAVNKRGERTRLQNEFQSGKGIRVLVMTTTAGGLSITLDRASNVFIFDETWDPDDQTQAEDRCHRASRIHQVTIYYLRTKDTIESAIADVTLGKSIRNVQVLDLRRLVTAGQ